MMNRIRSYARFLELLCLFVGIPLIIGSFILKWFFRSMCVHKDIYGAKTCIHISFLSSLFIQLLAIAIDGISIALLVWGCIYFVRLLGYYRSGELFSANTLSLYAKMSRIAFIWTLYNPIKFTLLSLVTTLNNSVGNRMLAVNFSSDDIFHIFIVGVFWVVTSLMQAAYELKREHDLTV